MDTNWQQGAWLVKNHLTPVMPELHEEQHIVQARDKCRGVEAALYPTENEEVKLVIDLTASLLS